MRAVIADIPQRILDERSRSGADRWDEMWEGVLHMPPMPNRDHQDLEGDLETWLRMRWAYPRGNRVYHQINVAAPGGWPDNYRIPDLVLLTPERFQIDRNEFFEGGPDVVVEIHSPGDEALDKLPFYAQIGVREVWVIDRDTRTPTVFVLGEGGYEEQSPADDGWIQSRATGIELRSEPGSRLSLRLAGDESTRQRFPRTD